MVDNLLDKASILLTPTAYNDGSMLSVKPNENLYGSELVTNGDFATDSDWTKQTSWSIGGGAANYDFLSDSKYIRQTLLNGGFVAGKTYKINFEITSGTAYMNINSNGGGLISLNTYSVGSYSIYVTPSISASDLLFYGRNTSGTAFSIDNVSVVEDLSGDFTFSRGSAATRVNEQGLVEEITDINLPRIDYSDGCGNWLLEPQSTNLTPYSEDFSQSAWVKTGLNITSNSIASPSGEVNADKWVEDTSNGAHNIRNNPNISVTNGAEYTMSIFAKAGERTGLRFTNAAESSVEGRFDLSNGTVTFTGTNTTFVGVEDYGNGWYRCIVSFVASTTIAQLNLGLMDGSALSYQGDGTSGLYAWGAQLENLSYATSYIPTNGAIATRLADVATNSGNSSLINSTEGVLYAEIAALADDGTNRIISLNNGTTNNIVRFYYGTTNNTIVGNVKSSGVTVFNYINVLTDATDFIKIALKYKENDFALWVNGTEVATDTSGATPMSGVLNRLDFSNAGNTSIFYGKTKALAVYKEALTDAQLQSLTTI